MTVGADGTREARLKQAGTNLWEEPNIFGDQREWIQRPSGRIQRYHRDLSISRFFYSILVFSRIR